jgi:methionyl-tRNA formyltransferase
VLKFIDVQLEGKKRMSARDLLNGVKMQAGEKLG